MKKIKHERYSFIELLRIVFLAFLIIWHGLHFSSADVNKYIDTKFVHSLTIVSVFGFATITGSFALSSNHLVSKNIFRLLFVVMLSSIMGTIIFSSLDLKISSYKGQIFSGSRDSWYLYSIIPTYIFFHLLKDKLKSLKGEGLFPFAVISLLVLTKCGRVFHMSMVFGITFQSVSLFLCALIGLSVRKIISNNFVQNHKLTINIFLVALLVFSVVFVLLVTIYKLHVPFRVLGRYDPLTAIMAISLVTIAILNNFYSKTINSIVKYSYYIYEFHGLGQVIGYKLMDKFIREHPHLQLWINFIVIFVGSYFASFIITLFQVNIYNKYFVKNIRSLGKGIEKKVYN